MILANIRGSTRNVIDTDSDSPLLPEVELSINRKSTRFSNQNAASPSSLEKVGTSSQLVTAFISILNLQLLFWREELRESHSKRTHCDSI